MVHITQYIHNDRVTKSFIFSICVQVDGFRWELLHSHTPQSPQSPFTLSCQTHLSRITIQLFLECILLQTYLECFVCLVHSYCRRNIQNFQLIDDMITHHHVQRLNHSFIWMLLRNEWEQLILWINMLTHQRPNKFCSTHKLRDDMLLTQPDIARIFAIKW